MAKREVKRSFTFEQQRQEINLLADDAGDKEQLDTLSTEGQNSLVEAINEVISTPEDEIFVNEVDTSTEEQRIIFAEESTRIIPANYETSGKAAGTNPSGDDYAKLSYDYGRGTEADRFTYNSQNNLLRVKNVKADIRNRNNDGVLESTGQDVLTVGTDADSIYNNDTAQYTGRLRTKQNNPPIEIQQKLLKLEEQARVTLANESYIDLATGVDVGAYVNVTNNKKIIYVSADDENASDLPDNDGSNINRPYKSIERALVEAAKRSYVGPGIGIEEGEEGADLFENFTILLFPGEYIVDNRPGTSNGTNTGTPFVAADISEETKTRSGEAYESTASMANELYKFNPPQGGVIVPRGTSIVGLDLRKTLIRPKYVPDPVDEEITRAAIFRVTGACYIWQFTIKDNKLAGNLESSGIYSHHKLTAFEYADYEQLEDYYRKIDKYSRTDEGSSLLEGDRNRFLDAQNLLLDNKEFIANLAVTNAYVDSAFVLTPTDTVNYEGETITSGVACVRDTIALIEEIAYNLAYGGNDRVSAVVQLYLNDWAGTLQGEGPDAIRVWQEASAICQSIVTNTTVDVTNFGGSFPAILGTAGINNTLTQTLDLSISDDAAVPGDDNTDPLNCQNVRSGIQVLWLILTDTVQAVIDGGNDQAAADAANIELDHITSTYVLAAPAPDAGATVDASAWEDVGGDGIPDSPSGAADYNQRIEENRIVGFVQNKYLSDTVASASPYVFNISLRSVWGLCGLESNGARSTGLRSMVLAQYTGISLQRDDRAFILNGVSTVNPEDPDERHTASLAEYREDWRHFHIKSTNNSFLQIVSVFAVGQADHFTTETGADHSITNSNSNFGNQSLIAKSHRTEIFKQDNGAFIVGLVPPRGLDPDKQSNVNIYDIDYGTQLQKFETAEVTTASTADFEKIYVKVNGQSLIKEGDIPEYFSKVPGTDRDQAELLLDDVNYLLGKRRYLGDSFPEAIYARLPKNASESTLSTFAARLRDNESEDVGDPNNYDPKAEYLESVIIDDSVDGTSQPVAPAADILGPIKTWWILDAASTENPNTGAPALYATTNLTTNNTHPGLPTSILGGGSKYKMVVGTNSGDFAIAVQEAPVVDFAIEGSAFPTGTDNLLETYRTTEGPAGEGEVTKVFVNTTVSALITSSGANATFDIIRNNSNSYIVKLITAGISYEIGDSFTITGDQLGGVTATDPAGHIVTGDIVSAGTGYTTGAATSGTATFTINSVDSNGAITSISVDDGGSGFTVGVPVTLTQAGSNNDATFDPTFVADGINNNDLIIHIISNENSGTDIQRDRDFDVLFEDSVGAATETVRFFVQDIVLPANRILETNDLYDYTSSSTRSYSIPSGGFDAEYNFSVVPGAGGNVWEYLGVWNDLSTPQQQGLTSFVANRVLGGSGFLIDTGNPTSPLNTIRVPGSFAGGADNTNDQVIRIDNVGGATITTDNFNSDLSVKRKYYGWEFARTINGEYFGRLVLLVDDSRITGTQIIDGVPVQFTDPPANTFVGFTNDQTEFPAFATVIPGENQDRAITGITNDGDGRFTITLDTAPFVRAPYYVGDTVTLINTVENGGTATLDGSYTVTAINAPTYNQIEFIVPTTSEAFSVNNWQATGTARKVSEEVTIRVKVAIDGDQTTGEGVITRIYPNDYDLQANPSGGDPGEVADQNFNIGWDTSGSNFSYDDRFRLSTGTGTAFLPEDQNVIFQIDPGPNNGDSQGFIVTLPARSFTSPSQKEDDFLPGSSLGIRYSTFDDNESLESQTINYQNDIGAAIPGPTINPNLSLFRRITQRLDSNSDGTLTINDGYEFNDNIISTLYVKRIQDTRTSNGNSELLWRLIVKLPKDGYNNIKLRAPEQKFIIHLKDPGLGFMDENYDYPFVYDYSQIGLVRDVKILTPGTGTPSTTTEDVGIAQADGRDNVTFIKTVRRGGDGVTDIQYEDYSNAVGAETLSPSGALFDVTYDGSGNTTSVAIASAGSRYNIGDKITLTDGTVIQVTKASTVNPRAFYVQNVEPIVEYEYNVRDGYYLVTALDANVTKNFDAFGGIGGLEEVSISNAGSGYTEDVYLNEALTGGSGENATADITVDATGSVTLVTINNPGDGYTTSDVLSATLAGGGSNFQLAVDEIDSVTDNTKTIVYGKQRLIGLEDIDPVDGIEAEINHRKQDASDLIEKNRLFIQKEAHGWLVNELQPGGQFDGRTNPSPNRCKRDIGYLVNGILRDLRYFGTNNTINTAQYYYSTGTQKFIENELDMTTATFDEVKNHLIAAQWNYETWKAGTSNTSSTIDVETDGLVYGMRVYIGGATLPSDEATFNTAIGSMISIGYIGDIDRTSDVITIYPDRTFGTPVTSIPGGAGTFYFRMEEGLGEDWTSPPAVGTETPVVDPTVIRDYDFATGECANVVSAINVLYSIFDDILNAAVASSTASSKNNNVANPVSVSFNTASFEDEAGILPAGTSTVRIFGAQANALNGDEIEVEKIGTTVTYELDVTFATGFTDNIVYYLNSGGVTFDEPTRATYVTEDVTLEGFGFPQNINYLYPETDLDNPKWNPKPSNTQYRKDVGNTIIKSNTLQEDSYERVSQYSITSEATKGVLNSILTGGAGATGFNDRIFGDIDLNAEFGAGETIDNSIMEAPYTNVATNLYGVDKSPVISFGPGNVPIFTDRCIIFDAETPISFYRPSIIRASSHTWEYVGFGPGNYSTGLPQFQDITLTQQETVNSQTVEFGGGFVASSGTNSVGDFYIGNQVIDAKGNQSNTLNFPRVKTSAENRLIDYVNLDSLAANSSSASFNPSSFSAVLTNSLQAIQEAQRNSFKASNIEASILTAGTLKVNNKISIANNVFEDTSNFPASRQDVFGFSKRASVNWFNTSPQSEEYQALANSYISPTDLTDWANVNSLIPSVPVSWAVVDENGDPAYVTDGFSEVSNVGPVDINQTFKLSSNFNVSGIDPLDIAGGGRWYDPVTDTTQIPLGTPTDTINNTNLNTYEGRSGQIIVTYNEQVNAAAIIPTNIWKPVDNTWVGVSQVDGSATTFLRGDKFVVSYFVSGGTIIYAVSTLDA